MRSSLAVTTKKARRSLITAPSLVLISGDRLRRRPKPPAILPAAGRGTTGAADGEPWPVTRRFTAEVLPLRLSNSTSNVTVWPSSRLRRPDCSSADMWTNRSSPPASGTMKPKPLVALNHFTMPEASPWDTRSAPPPPPPKPPPPPRGSNGVTTRRASRRERANRRRALQGPWRSACRCGDPPPARSEFSDLLRSEENPACSTAEIWTKTSPTAILGLDEPKTFRGVEPLHRTRSHSCRPRSVSLRPSHYTMARTLNSSQTALWRFQDK